MLDTTTKQKIDSLRNLLVGKVPDPKSQVEQITVALFYKFMWDRDKEIKDLGGNATFFVREFEKYSWENLFAPDLGGSECIKLYSEAIEEMENNPNIPSIFRDIFKRAFLPYNDPYTLRLFLKEINDFHYSNSEKLGDGFEYLLSILGTQGDAGQFRTPRHIIDFITEVVNPQKGDRICDPACGTAGFIISAYKHILKTNTKESLGDLLTPEDKKRLGNNLVGLDIDPMMVKLALANMYLHGLNEPHIYEYDSLTSEERWDDIFDVVLANPPFMTPSGGIRPHKRFAVNATKAEVLFTSYINTHLSNNGRAGIIVPEGIIFQSSNAYKDLRKQLIESSLIGVVSLPSGVFNPYSGVKTSILILDKELNKKTEKIFFVEVKNDGFNLGKQRNIIDKNDLPGISKAINEFSTNLKKGVVKKHEDLNFLTKNKILESSDITLSFYRYFDQEISTKHEIINLIDVIDVKKPYLISSKEIKTNGIYPVVDQSKDFISGYSNNKEKLNIIKNPVIIFGDHTRVFKYVDFDFVGSGDGTKVLTNSEKFNTKFLYYLLKIYPLKDLGYSRHFKLLKTLKVPIPPLKIQKEVVEELEQYQKVIDGAKQVVNNYKPHFAIDDNWDKVELKHIATMKYGLGESALEKGDYRFIRISDINSLGLLKSNNKKFINISKNDEQYILNEGDILMARTGATYGKCLYFEGNEQSVYAGYLIRITLDRNKILNRFFWYFTQSNIFIKQKEKLVTGGGQPQFNANTINKLVVPIPPISIQKELVNKIEKERKIVEGNKKLIEIYSRKIEYRINKIWEE
jgi:type I restriction enzyme M protein